MKKRLIPKAQPGLTFPILNLSSEPTKFGIDVALQLKRLYDLGLEKAHSHITDTETGDEFNGTPQGNYIWDYTEHPEATEGTVGLVRNGNANRYDRIHSRGVVRGLATIDLNKNGLLSMYNLSDDDFYYYRNFIPSMFYLESGGGERTNKAYNGETGRSGLSPVIKSPIKKALTRFANTKTGRYLAEHEWGKLSDLAKGESIGLGNVKPALHFSLQEMKDRGYDKLSDSYAYRESPEFSGMITMETLIRNGNKLKEMMQGLPENLKNDKDLFTDLLLVSYNQGFKNIQKNIDKYNKNHNENEIRLYSNMSYPTHARTYRSYSDFETPNENANYAYSVLLPEVLVKNR